MAISEAEAIAFRGEINALDSDILQFYRLYYVTGIAAIIGWIISSNSRSLPDLVLGPDGNNLFALLVLSGLNAVSLTFLLQRSMEIHELAQFLVSSSAPNAAAVQWELWRKRPQSVTRTATRLHSILLTLVPIVVSSAILTTTGTMLLRLPDAVSAQRHTTPIASGARPAAPPLPVGKRATPRKSAEPVPHTPRYAINLRTSRQAVWWARIAWLAAALAHVLPGILIYQHLTRVPDRWTAIWNEFWAAPQRQG